MVTVSNVTPPVVFASEYWIFVPLTTDIVKPDTTSALTIFRGCHGIDITKHPTQYSCICEIPAFIADCAPLTGVKHFYSAFATAWSSHQTIWNAVIENIKVTTFRRSAWDGAEKLSELAVIVPVRFQCSLLLLWSLKKYLPFVTISWKLQQALHH